MKVHLSRTPEGKAPHVVVLVHGCCTTPDAYLREWYQARGDALISAIARKNVEMKNKARAWEIVVWDWSNFTRNLGLFGLDIIASADFAYSQAFDPGIRLAEQIGKHPYYKYIHLIGHSAGANLIDWAAKRLDADKKLKNKERPFIHLTFLDAYTPPDGDDPFPFGDDDTYGSLPYNYLKHYTEHYVDKSLTLTDTDLRHAFNFNITGWALDKDGRDFGHQWPLIWYTRAIEFPGYGGAYGYLLSLEGGNEKFSTLAKRFPHGRSCELTHALAKC